MEVGLPVQKLVVVAHALDDESVIIPHPPMVVQIVQAMQSVSVAVTMILVQSSPSVWVPPRYPSPPVRLSPWYPHLAMLPAVQPSPPVPWYPHLAMLPAVQPSPPVPWYPHLAMLQAVQRHLLLVSVITNTF